MRTTKEILLQAKAAVGVMTGLSAQKKNEALEAIASILEGRQAEWLAANQEDLEAARASGMRQSMLDLPKTVVMLLALFLGKGR